MIVPANANRQIMKKFFLIPVFSFTDMYLSISIYNHDYIIRHTFVNHDYMLITIEFFVYYDDFIKNSKYY